MGIWDVKFSNLCLLGVSIWLFPYVNDDPVCGVLCGFWIVLIFLMTIEPITPEVTYSPSEKQLERKRQKIERVQAWIDDNINELKMISERVFQTHKFQLKIENREFSPYPKLYIETDNGRFYYVGTSLYGPREELEVEMRKDKTNSENRKKEGNKVKRKECSYCSNTAEFSCRYCGNKMCWLHKSHRTRLGYQCTKCFDVDSNAAASSD